MARTLTYLAASLCFAAISIAQPPEPDPTPLKGPDVPQTQERTLIRRDMNGRFQRTEGRPEEAAAALLDISPDVREKVKTVGADRATTLGVFLIERIEDVRAVAEATEAGERDRASDLVRDLWHEFEASEPQTPLLSPLAAILTAEQNAETTRLVDEYWSALIDWELRNAKDKSDAARARVKARLAFSLFQDEVRLAYDRVIKPYRDRIEGLNLVLDPTPEQREAIREAVIAFVRESKAKPTPQQRRALLGTIYRLLDEDRRAKFFDVVAQQASEG